MRATRRSTMRSGAELPRGTTLLARVQEPTSACDSDAAVVSRARAELASGRTRLVGNFRDVPVAVFLG